MNADEDDDIISNPIPPKYLRKPAHLVNPEVLPTLMPKHQSKIHSQISQPNKPKLMTVVSGLTKSTNLGKSVIYCGFGRSCNNQANCKYKHDGSKCKFDTACTNDNCQFIHSKQIKCRFEKCTNVNCPYVHLN
jgi:hypothetical protein